VGHVARSGEMRSECKILDENQNGIYHYGDLGLQGI
jgi:hypothetical protein